MGRSGWWRGVAAAALVAGSLWLPAQAQAGDAPHPVTVVASGEGDCTSWWHGEFSAPPCEVRLELAAVDGAGGSAVLTRGLDKARQVIDLRCLSFAVTGEGADRVDGVDPYTLRASGPAEDGTTYYVVARDGGLPMWNDGLEVTTQPGGGACGTPVGWGQWLESVVVVTS